MPAPHHSVFYRLDALPAAKTNSVKALKACKDKNNVGLVIKILWK